MRQVAFIRGINVGGKVLVSMVDLKKMFEKAGFKNVKTLLASGNVVFDTSLSPATAEKKMETELKKKYKRDIATLVRTRGELEKLAALNPFKNTTVTKNTRLYVTFCRKEPKNFKPAQHPGFHILGTYGREIFSVLELSDKIKTPDIMKVLGNIGTVTVRNWNTVQKVLQSSA